MAQAWRLGATDDWPLLLRVEEQFGMRPSAALPHALLPTDECFMMTHSTAKTPRAPRFGFSCLFDSTVQAGSDRPDLRCAGSALAEQFTKLKRCDLRPAERTFSWRELGVLGVFAVVMRIQLYEGDEQGNSYDVRTEM
ncbi:MAG TPA: hypothetical protein VI197_31050 [Polyangiaceae bacterium]